MIPKEIISKAIEGGWRADIFGSQKKPITVEWRQKKQYSSDYRFFIGGSGFWDIERRFIVERIALEPTFWQALGKALGWEPDTERDVTAGECESYGEWFANAHDFYALILTGDDTESYWKELLQQDV